MSKGIATTLLVCWVGLATLAWPARAAEDAAKPAPSKPYVVLIGIGDYADQAIKSRPHAESDVKDLFDLQRAYRGLTF